MEGINEKSIIVKSKLELEDFVHTRKSLIRVSIFKGIFKSVIIYIILFVIILAVLTSYQPSDMNTAQVPDITEHNAVDNPPFFIEMLPMISFVLFIVFCVFGYRWLIRYSAKKHYNSNKLAREETTYIFTEEGIERSSESGTYRAKWNELYKIIETKRAVMLYSSDMTAWIIPKRFFEGNDFERFVSLAYPQFPKKKIKKVK
ncbi:MAG TPA: YcxB family protein [Clostridiaceae bacterium]|nr:YcxB family protein [Clostridiaceae bacterium]